MYYTLTAGGVVCFSSVLIYLYFESDVDTLHQLQPYSSIKHDLCLTLTFLVDGLPYWRGLLHSVLLFHSHSTCTRSHDSLCRERGQSFTLTLQYSLVIDQITTSQCSAVSNHENDSLLWRLHIFRFWLSLWSSYLSPLPLFLSLFPWPWLWL